MTAFTRYMPHVATYWSPGVSDGFGGTSYGAPIAIQCRWQDSTDLFRAPSGEETASEAIVYPDRELAIGGVLAREDQTATPDPANADGAKEIRQVGKSPSLGGDVVLHKVWL